jgi:hypothetical protein
MKIQYSLNENGFLENLLYRYSISEIQKKKLLKSRVLVPTIYLFFAAYLMLQQKINYGIGFVAFAFLWFLLYPFYNKWRVKKYYLKHIAENFQNKIGITSELIFDKDIVYMNDKGSESKVRISEFENLIETKDYYYLDTFQKSSIIIPKKEVSDKNQFLELIKNYNINIKDKTEWTW